LLSNQGIWIARDASDVQRLKWTIRVIVSTLDNYTQQQYSDELAGEGGLARGYQYDVNVDANTGEVINKSCSGVQGKPSEDKSSVMPLCSKPLRPIKGMSIPCTTANLTVNDSAVSPVAKPFVIDGTPYLYVRYLSLVGSNVKWNTKRVIISGLSAAQLTPGADTANIGGKTVKLEKPVKLFFDRTYISLELMNQLSGNAFEWDKQTLTLNLKKKK
jgi:hypothetical protein